MPMYGKKQRYCVNHPVFGGSCIRMNGYKLQIFILLSIPMKTGK
jgi:hypothetical protein